MPFHFCLTQPDGEKLCFDIPVLVLELPVGPDPDPTLIIRRGRENPWIQGQGIDAEIATTLANMATVMRVAEHLDGELPGMLENMFRDQIGRMNLPPGAQVEITRQRSV